MFFDSFRKSWPILARFKRLYLEHRYGLAVLMAFVLVFTFLALRHASTTSATFDENTHLPAGYSYVKWDDYRLNPEHPPFVKKLAGFFASFQRPWPGEIETPESDFAAHPTSNTEREIQRAWATGLAKIDSQWLFGHYFLYGPTSEALQRTGSTHPLQIPTDVALAANDFMNNANALLFSGRLAVLLLGVLLAILIYCWAHELWGMAGGALSLALFCLDPNFIAHSSLVTTDVGISALMFGSVYFLWRTCRSLSLSNVAFMLLFFGLAFTSKFTSVLLLPIFLVILLGRGFSDQEWSCRILNRNLGKRSAKLGAAACLFVAALCSAYLMIWALYSFRYSAAKAPARAAATETLVLSESNVSPSHREPGFLPIEHMVRRAEVVKTLLNQKMRRVPERELLKLIDATPVGLSGKLILFAQHHKLLPEAYLYGFAYARLQSLARPAFLRGELSPDGFWDYFLWCFLLKTPLPSLVAIVAGLIFALRRREPGLSGAAFLLAPILIYLVVSMSSNLNIGHRHLLPIYPFLFTLAGGLVLEWHTLSSRLKPYVASGALAAIAISGSFVFSPPWRPVLVYPHYLAYFNELAGGPQKGRFSLSDSNIDWGQDLKNLKLWLEENPPSTPLFLCYFGMADPRYHGIQHLSVPRIFGGYPLAPTSYNELEASGRYQEVSERFRADLKSGTLLAISATNLTGAYAAPQIRAVWQQILSKSVLVDQVGHSVLIYKILPNSSSNPPSSGQKTEHHQ